MYRRLLIFRSNLSEILCQRRTEPQPRPRALEGIRLRWLDPAELADENWGTKGRRESLLTLRPIGTGG